MLGLQRLILALGLLGGGGAAAEDRPNVIVILTDDQGWGDVGVHGNDIIQTPHLDGFARDGVEMVRYYTSPVCSPTRASLMTGRYYYRTGVIHTSRGGAKMHGSETTLAEYLREAGYRTGVFGKWHLGDTYPMRPQDQGFEEVLVHKSGGIGQTPDRPNAYTDPVLWQNGDRRRYRGYCTDIFFDAAQDFIRSRERAPFFVYLATNAPHTPLEVDERYVEPFRRVGVDETTARVYGMLRNLDENLGRLLATLERERLRSNTIILFLGDNGPGQRRFNGPFQGRKGSVWEGGIRSLCFLQWPGHWAGGAKISVPTAHIDVVPSILDWVGVNPPGEGHLDGQSWGPLLRGSGTFDVGRSLFLQCHRGLVPRRYQNAAVVRDRWKLVFNAGAFSDEAFEPEGELGRVGLFDVVGDPSESQDLQAAERDTMQALLSAYRDWFEDVAATRQFLPGVLHVGAEAENPVRLCRYQDGRFESGVSLGWDVVVEASGVYEIELETQAEITAGQLVVDWRGQSWRRSFSAGKARGRFFLPAGRGRLDIWCDPQNGVRQRPGDNSTVGDASVALLGASVSN